jgi:rhodanese-related sulfurtransferase
MQRPLEIAPEELAQLLEQKENPRLIDCRELDEWYICKLPNAELLPLGQLPELAATKLGDDLHQHLVVYCHHGVRSMHATQWLRRAGYSQAQSLHGGIDLWAELIAPEMQRY